MLLEALSSLALATVISFAGSVQLGPVNFGTLHTALHKDKKSAIRFGFGGSLPELLYCGLAVAGAGWLGRFEQWQEILQYCTVVVLFVFGVYLWFQKSHSPEGQSSIQTSKGNELLVGATFGLLNPQLFPFWLVVITNLKSYGLITSTHVVVQVGFVVGAALGAFLLQLLVAEVTSRKREFIYMRLTRNYNKVLGAIIVGIAILQLLINL
ncbi:LysE family translocator [Roseivirga thermotolerans]|uniref:Lysine transporter LysE n=1 Tax=Roseivirga thermotolerans TaxID=1758176 RepID=A0ABQ3I5X7_9BACT|nr:LysE family transporter [Roseivirga thermotolerans]GHE56456.1 hypothetical protein GCM10011340_09220 [Roseivirga thermotolerans]